MRQLINTIICRRELSPVFYYHHYFCEVEPVGSDRVAALYGCCGKGGKHLNKKKTTRNRWSFGDEEMSREILYLWVDLFVIENV